MVCAHGGRVRGDVTGETWDPLCGAGGGGGGGGLDGVSRVGGRRGWRAACETDEVDWKSELPHKQNEKSQEEFAKDVAAMADTGGGVFVYGIQEGRGQGTARALTPVACALQHETSQKTSCTGSPCSS